MGFLAKAQALTDDLIALRRDFHGHPDTEFEVQRTTEIVARTLGAERRTLSAIMGA